MSKGLKIGLIAGGILAVLIGVFFTVRYFIRRNQDTGDTKTIDDTGSTGIPADVPVDIPPIPAEDATLGKHQIKKTLKQYFKDTFAAGWRPKWKSEKAKMKDFAIKQGGKKKHWRKYANAYTAKYYPSIMLGAGLDSSDFDGDDGEEMLSRVGDL